MKSLMKLKQPIDTTSDGKIFVLINGMTGSAADDVAKIVKITKQQLLLASELMALLAHNFSPIYSNFLPAA